MKTEAEVRAALESVRASKAEYKPSQSMYGFALGAESMLIWMLDEEE